MSPRSVAARVVARVLGDGRSLSDTLPEALQGLAPRDRGLVQELCYGTLRWHLQLESVLSKLLRAPLKRHDLDLQCLMLVGLYQLSRLRVPPFAAVSDTVAATADLGKPWARGLVNGVLRTFQREGPRMIESLKDNQQALTAHPGWWLDALRQAWPEHWQSVVDADNARPPMTLRVNRAQGSREDYLGALAQAGIAGHALRHADDGIELEKPLAVEELPGFATGRVSVQDGAAQLAAPLLAVEAGQRVLDACAAPGGKTTHILETAPHVKELVALDSDCVRLQRLRENLERLGAKASVRCGDAGNPASWWDGRPFDRILLDAPCSATGVVRRHPDIKILRRGADIARLAVHQSRLLAALWPLLARGGMLLYGTCSVLPEENERQAMAFLATHDDAREEPIAAPWGHERAVGRQILPGEDHMDGFYYTRIRKL